jgi:hypothetical protein
MNTGVPNALWRSSENPFYLALADRISLPIRKQRRGAEEKMIWKRFGILFEL